MNWTSSWGTSWSSKPKYYKSMIIKVEKRDQDDSVILAGASLVDSVLDLVLLEKPKMQLSQDSFTLQ